MFLNITKKLKLKKKTEISCRKIEQEDFLVVVVYLNLSEELTTTIRVNYFFSTDNNYNYLICFFFS